VQFNWAGCCAPRKWVREALGRAYLEENASRVACTISRVFLFVGLSELRG
jgi:hypothetical protein